jgi:hypothetical protein
MFIASESPGKRVRILHVGYPQDVAGHRDSLRAKRRERRGPAWSAYASSVIITFLFLLVSSLSAPFAMADELAQKGREVFKNNRHSVVTVQIVVKSKFSMGGMGGQASESRQDVTGTLIDASGLTVLSLAATDPGQMMQNVMSSMSDEESKFKIETELSDVKILLEDGTEVPAEVVLRDKDLDLAFVRPKAKVAAQITALDLTKSGKVEILDQVIALNRLGNAAGRAYAASVERIAAVVERPRLFYVPETSFTTTALGAPAFTLDGKLVGLFVMRSLKGRSGGAGGMMGMQPENITGIILPADAILKAARQVPDAGNEKTKEQN